MLRLRKIFFYLFLIVYCVACPITILYALGYILKPGSERGLVKAGLIYVSSRPPGAVVYVENKRFSEKTPTLIQGLLPGQYRLTAFLKGYKLWTRAVTIEAEKAATFSKIILLPERWKTQIILKDEFRDLVPLQSERYVILDKGDHPKALYFYDLKDKELLERDVRSYDLFDKKIYAASEDSDFEVHVFPKKKALFFGRQGEIWSSNHSFFLGREKILGAAFDAETQKAVVWNEGKLGVLDWPIKRKPSVQWLVSGDRQILQAFWVYGGSHILFRDGDGIFLLNLSEEGQKPEIQECFHVKRGSSILYSEKTGKIYFLEKNTGKFCQTELLIGNEPQIFNQEL